MLAIVWYVVRGLVSTQRQHKQLRPAKVVVERV